jgi:hypothetical protein
MLLDRAMPEDAPLMLVTMAFVGGCKDASYVILVAERHRIRR